jgi:ferredoxin-nitrite reductase
MGKDSSVLSARSPFGSAQRPSKTPASSGCPGLFCPTVAQDGILTRIRVPGGLLSAAQCRVLAEIGERLNGTLGVTNRANLQLRGLQQTLPADILLQLQTARLAGPLRETDHLRNIMASPTAGIDPAQWVDTRPLVRALDRALSVHPGLAALSPKFSLGIDGGEQVSIASLPNDLTLKAFPTADGLRFAVSFRGSKLKEPLLLQPAEGEPFVTALAQVYLEVAESLGVAESKIATSAAAKPRLKDAIESVGIQPFLERIQSYLPFALTFGGFEPAAAESALAYGHLGIHSQHQPNLSYMGVALPLGRLTGKQLFEVAALSETYGSASVRLTPWRNLIVSDVPNHHLLRVQQSLEELGLHASATNIWGSLVACSGQTGCSASATDTQADAAAIAQFATDLSLDFPIAIHLTGCSKSCAYHGSSDVTLVGTQVDETRVAYSLYIGEKLGEELGEKSGEELGAPFGRLLATHLAPDEVPQRIGLLLRVYQCKRSAPSQPFRAFANQSSLDQLQQWLEAERSTADA